MSHQTTKFSREEPIPGYTTTELIGRGGFGEVWRAAAPGGVPKAIKMVFGDDPSRSESELRSLNRIKDVRHPLILSIDRIEIVKGTLVIVTELGDCNLKEYCQKYRAQGLVGIPQKRGLETHSRRCRGLGLHLRRALSATFGRQTRKFSGIRQAFEDRRFRRRQAHLRALSIARPRVDADLCRPGIV